MITYHEGNLFEANCQTLVCTVNCEGVMGKGIALEFKRGFPKMFTEYRNVCKHGNALRHGGDLWLYTYENLSQLTLWVNKGDHNELITGWQSKVLCFATKEQWRYPSKLEWIERGLQEFVRRYKEWGITSIAFPKLGCDNGGLDWDKVQQLMEHHLSKIDIPVEIYI